MKTTIDRLILSLCLASTLALALSLAGCRLIAGTKYALTGPPEVPAKYTPEKTPMLVMVENYRQSDPYGTEDDFLASAITNELRVHDIAPMIDPAKIEALKIQKGPDYQAMRVGDIGQALGAAQVLYVDLVGSQATVQPGNVAEAKISVKVKIIDVTNGKTLWPLDSAGGYPVNFALPPMEIKPGVSTASVRDELMTELSAQIGRLFYKWKPKDMDEHDNQ